MKWLAVVGAAVAGTLGWALCRIAVRAEKRVVDPTWDIDDDDTYIPEELLERRLGLRLVNGDRP